MPEVVQPSSTFAWDKLAFGLYPTHGYAKFVYREGAWGPLEWVEEPFVKLHVGSVAVNYGASAFEGLKAFRGPDGHVRTFRPVENAKRMNVSADFVCMPEVPENVFLKGVHAAVARNLDLVPPHAPYGSSGSLYVRPLLFASGEMLILAPPSEFMFIVYVTPTGSLYGTAGSTAPAVDALVLDEFDRTAPLGTGSAKLAGNYAPVFKHMAAAKKAGYPITLHLDSKTRKYIDEFSTSNFLGLKYGATPDAPKTLVVPVSPSILKSVTTKSIVEIAKSFGWQVEQRPVEFQEVVSGQFDEVCACGTAAAITPIKSISYKPEGSSELKKIVIGDGEKAGKGFLDVLSELTGIQSGVREDKFGFLWPKEGVDAANP